MADRDVEVDILATDKTSRATRTAARNFDRLNKTVKDSTKGLDADSKAGLRMSKVMGTVAKTVGKATAVISSAASSTGALALGLVQVAKYGVAAGKAVAKLTPLAAFLPSLAASVGLVVSTLKLAAPGLVRALQPVLGMFKDADGNAGKLTLRLQDLISRGVEPLAKQFAKVNLPTISAGMDRIAVATNKVVVSTLKWLNSTEGQSLISKITNSTAAAMEKLGPKVTAAAIALGRLAGRAGDKAITGLGDLVGRILDKFTAWADSTSMEDIQKALDDLGHYFDKFKDIFNGVREIGKWLGENAAAVKVFTAVLATIGIVIGIATGTWIPAIIGALILLAGNFDTVKNTIGPVISWMKKQFESLKKDKNVQELVASIKSHFDKMRPIFERTFRQIQDTVIPKLKELKKVILEDLVPAFKSFIDAVSPIVVWIADKLSPMVSRAFGTMLDVIKGFVKIVSGIINVFTAVITLDWGKLWKGFTQIFSGAWTIIKSVFTNAVSSMFTIISTLVQGIGARLGQVKDKIVGVFKSAGSWLAGVGKAIVDGLINAITGAWGKVSSAIGGLIDKAKNAIPAAIRGALGFDGLRGGWAPSLQMAQFDSGASNYAMAGGGNHRVGGPTEVHVENVIQLDGAPVAAIASKTVTAAQRREKDRQRVGTR